MKLLRNRHLPTITGSVAHEHHWDCNEFRWGHRAWEHDHRMRERLTDAQLQAEWARLDAEQHGWVDMTTITDGTDVVLSPISSRK